jgi:hypothetical protein
VHLTRSIGVVQVDYDDGLIACSDDTLVIRRYGTLLRAKKIPYTQIRGVTQIGLGSVRRWRLWGTTKPGLWFNLDWNRRHKSVALLVDIGKRVKAGDYAGRSAAGDRRAPSAQRQRDDLNRRRNRW